MKSILLICLFLSSTLTYANDAKNQWHNTVLSEATIKKIQQAQYQYKRCATDEMNKLGVTQFDSRHATETIIKNCEKALSAMRQVYLNQKVPGKIADRHLKKMRFDITRRVLKQMMFIEAARKSGNLK